MILLTNGCSFTEGYNLPSISENWPSQLSYLLDTKNINLALGGASNDRIYRTTIEYLNSNPAPKLVVIGWTLFNRNELSHSDGVYLRITNTSCLSDTTELSFDQTTIHKFWAINLYNNYINYRNWVNYVLHLQDHFQSKNIKYLFFTGLGNNYIQDFLLDSDRALELSDLSWQWRDRKKYKPCREIHNEHQLLKSLVEKINLDQWILNNQETMQQYLVKRNYKTDDTGHFLGDGHRAWATCIENFL